MMTTGVDAALGGAKKLLGAASTAAATASGGKHGKRQLLDDATRSARVLTDYHCDYDYCRSGPVLGNAVHNVWCSE
jgi:hypothetical protein